MLTGDGHHSDILRGLKHIKKLKEANGLHVNVLKAQHHLSENNIDDNFCRTITADHYVICGNGEHDNPDLEALNAILRSRLGKGDQLSPKPEADNRFNIGINSNSTVTKKKEAVNHMKKVEKLLTDSAQKSKGKLSVFFLEGSSFKISI